MGATVLVFDVVSLEGCGSGGRTRRSISSSARSSVRIVAHSSAHLPRSMSPILQIPCHHLVTLKIVTKLTFTRLKSQFHNPAPQIQEYCGYRLIRL